MTDVAPASAPTEKPKTSWRAHVPGTREYRRKWHREARSYMRFVRMQDPWLFGDDWKRVERPMRHHSNRAAISDLWAETVAGPVRVAIGLSTLVAVVVMPWIVSRVAAIVPSPESHVSWMRNGALLMIFVLQIALFFGLAKVMLFAPARKRGRPIVPDEVWVFWSASVGCLYAWVAYRLLTPHSHVHAVRFTIACACISTVLLGLNALMMNAVNSIVLRIAERRRRALFGRSIAIQLLYVSALQCTYPAATERVIETLENAAQIFERDFPRMNEARDPATEVWTRKEFGAMAAAIRELKRLVTVRTKNTVEELRESVRKIILAILDEQYDDVPRARVEDFWKQRPLARAGRAARTVAIAVAPIVILAFGKRLIEIDAEAVKVFTTGAYVWAGVGLMMVIDPEFTAKLAGTNLSSLIKGGKG